MHLDNVCVCCVLERVSVAFLRFAHNCQQGPNIEGKRPNIEAKETYY